MNQLLKEMRRNPLFWFWPGAVVMVFVATTTALFVTNGGRSTWFVGVLTLVVYLVFAATLFLLPPRSPVSH